MPQAFPPAKKHNNLVIVNPAIIEQHSRTRDFVEKSAMRRRYDSPSNTNQRNDYWSKKFLIGN
jgi:hypothetical protein